MALLSGKNGPSFEVTEVFILMINKIRPECKIISAPALPEYSRNYNNLIEKLNVELSPSKKICVLCLIESPLKMIKNVFYFILKALFVLKIFKFLSWLFGHVGKTAWLERQGWLQNRRNLVNKHLQYTYCPISQEVNVTRLWNLVNL